MSRSPNVISNWYQSFESLSTSSLEFYDSIEQALKDKAAPSVTTKRIEYAEGGLLSAKRTYLRVEYGKYVFDICAAPFGKDFFFSWWLGKEMLSIGALIGCGATVSLPILFAICVAVAGVIKGFIFFAVLVLAAFPVASLLYKVNVEDVLGALPMLGPIYLRFFRETTYYAEDTRQMFEETVHRVVTNVVSGVLTINKLEPLSLEQLKPTSRASDGARPA